MQIYTIIGGVNGCGKSSLTGALKAERSDLGVLIDVDKAALQLFRKKLGGQSTTPILLCKTAFFPALLDAGKIAVRKIDECLEKGISFTQETTLSGARTERTIRRAKERGYTIRLYYIGLDTMEESLGRIRNRVAKGGHDIPKADVERRFQSRFTDVLRVLPYCDEARFFDNDNGFVEVAEYRNGELIPRVSNPPRWLLELMEKLKKLPPPLRKQALLRFAGAGACFCLLSLVAVGYRQPMLWFPFLVMGVFSAGSGALLVWRADQGKVLVVEGVCREVESTLFRRRPKAVVMECGDRQVKVYLHARVRNLAVGERLRIYVAESAPVYEEDDILVLSGYLAVEVGKK